MLSLLADSTAGNLVGGIFALIILALELALFIAVIAGFWKTFEKAGKPGWASIVPIYNIIVLTEISGKPMWYVILFFIPCVNFVASILVNIGVAKAFGKGDGFGIGLALLPFVFFPILGFGDAQYVGSNSISQS